MQGVNLLNQGNDVIKFVQHRAPTYTTTSGVCITGMDPNFYQAKHCQLCRIPQN